MQKLPLTLAALAFAAAATACSRGEAAPVSITAAPSADVIAPAMAGGPDSLAWGPAPAIFPAGAQIAVLAGDPFKDGEYTVRLRMPNNYRIPAHTHPTDEHVTVIKGNFRVGMGPKFDASALTTLQTGGFVTAPAGQAHFAQAQGETIVQVHGLGPFSLTYVNPADTPAAAR